jgi:hypothetical protein
MVRGYWDIYKLPGSFVPEMVAVYEGLGDLY